MLCYLRALGDEADLWLCDRGKNRRLGGKMLGCASSELFEYFSTFFFCPCVIEAKERVN